MTKPYVVGIDVGGQTTKLGIVDARGNVLEQSVIRTDNHTDAKLFIADLAKAVNELIEISGGKDKIRGIGVGAPNGNYYTGKIVSAPNLAWGRSEVDFANMLSNETGIPVALTNDANAAAVGEMTYGAARGMKHFIMITLGTGVGSGIVINGEVVYGYDGFAGELGHTISEKTNGRPCGCGRNGCLETYASATGVARTAREILETTDKDSLLRKLDINKISSKDVYDAAIQGDEVALEIFRFTGKILGESLANFVAFSAPEAVILFGGLTKAGDLIKNPIIEHMNLNMLDLWKDNVKVIFSELKESDAAILGASALAWEL